MKSSFEKRKDFIKLTQDLKLCDDVGVTSWWFVVNMPWILEASEDEVLTSFKEYIGTLTHKS